MWEKIHQATLDIIKDRDERNQRVAEKLNASGFRIYLDEAVGDNEITFHVGKNIWKIMQEKGDG